MRKQRSEKRILCTEIVEVLWKDGRGKQQRATALLEDICRKGICLQVEHPMPVFADVQIRCGASSFDGITRYCGYLDFSYFVGVELAAHSQWSRTEFEPSHMLDLSN